MLSFPLSIAEFFALLPIGEIKFTPMPRAAINITGGGDVLSFDLAPMLWEGSVTLGKMSGSERDHPDLMLDVLGPSGRLFWAFDTRRPYPKADPTGSVLGAAAPTIASVPNAREMTLAGLPAGYVLSRGDYLAFNYETPSRRALHRVVNATVTANGAGTTPVFEVSPALRPGATVGAAVTLKQAACKALLIPGKTEKGTTRSTVTEGMSFSFIQSLKG